MLLNELFEGGTKHVTFCFGRMNPPTIGHKQVLDTMKAQGGDMRVFVSQTQDAKKNPLDYGTKIKFIKELFPEYAKDVVDNAGLNTVVKVASFLFEQGYNAATFVAGSDRLEDMKKLLEQYNGIEGKAHGYYKFDVIDFVSSGDREDGAEGVAGVSASGAREAAANNNFEKFKAATGAGELAEPLFKAVRKGMKITESISESPIEMDPSEPMNPMIVGHDKANPAKLKYRMLRAAGQLKDLASRAEGASPAEWQTMARQFEELKMNMEQIRHALEELGKMRKKGGVRSRGIDPMVDDINEFSADGDEEHTLHKYARIWYNGNDDIKQKVEQVLDRMGWEIGNIESDEGGVFVVQSDDENGNSYTDFSPDDLAEHIVKVKGGYELKSKHGNKNLGKYSTKAGAEKRERQVQYFKHAHEDSIPFAGAKVGQKAGRAGQLKGTDPKEYPRNKLVGG
jgi:hypothetical protein